MNVILRLCEGDFFSLFFPVNNDKPPLFLGPLYMHFGSTLKIMKKFIQSVEMELNDPILGVEVSGNALFNTDEEAAIVKALESVFPEAAIVFCVIHMKKNFARHLDKKMRVDLQVIKKLRRQIFFDEDALIKSEDEEEFNKRKNIFDAQEEVQELYAASGYLKDFLERVLSNVLHPKWLTKGIFFDFKEDSNDAECLNSILKRLTRHQAKTLPQLVSLFASIWRSQDIEVMLSFQKRGTLRLHDRMKRFLVPQKKWKKMSKEQRKNHLARFYKGYSPRPNTVTNKTGDVTVPISIKKVRQKPNFGKFNTNGKTINRTGRSNYTWTTDTPNNSQKTNKSDKRKTKAQEKENDSDSQFDDAPSVFSTKKKRLQRPPKVSDLNSSQKKDPAKSKKKATPVSSPSQFKTPKSKKIPSPLLSRSSSNESSPIKAATEDNLTDDEMIPPSPQSGTSKSKEKSANHFTFPEPDDHYDPFRGLSPTDYSQLTTKKSSRGRIIKPNSKWTPSEPKKSEYMHILNKTYMLPKS